MNMKLLKQINKILNDKPMSKEEIETMWAQGLDFIYHSGDKVVWTKEAREQFCLYTAKLFIKNSTKKDNQ